MAKRADNRADSRLNEIAGVAIAALDDSPEGLPARVIAAADESVIESLSDSGVAVTSWNRFAVGGRGDGRGAKPWPEADGAYDAAVIRLPGGWSSFTMTLHALLAHVPAGAPVWIYGGSEEGVTSVENHLDGLVDGLEVALLKRRTRVLRGVRSAVPARGAMADWEGVHEIAVPGVQAPLSLRFHPGCFAEGRLDPATRLLLEAVPTPKPGTRVLDFACGTGIIAASLRARTPELELSLLDADALALADAKLNVPDARYFLGDGLGALDVGGTFNLIVSNPPIHRGRQEDFTVLRSLLEMAPRRLSRSGVLWFVVQRTAGAARLMEPFGAKASRAAETNAFQVWRLDS